MNKAVTIAIAALGLVTLPPVALAQNVGQNVGQNLGQNLGQTGTMDGFDRAPWWAKSGVIAQTGRVKKLVPANRASFSAVFRAVDKTAEAAQTTATRKVRALQQALGGLGRDKVLTTTNVTIWPLYQQYRDAEGNMVDDERGDRITGYEVGLSVNLHVRDMAQLGQAYSLVMAAVPSDPPDIRFQLVEDHDLNLWLMTEAAKDARRRAQATVAATGGVLGAVRLIDMSGQACHSDLMGPAPVRLAGSDDAGTETVVVASRRTKASIDAPLDANLAAAAMQAPFIQTPPLVETSAEACVVYELK